MSDLKATLFDIYRGTTHDGPGTRDTAFFAGCPLSCLWCHNPEGLLQKNQVWHEPKTCIGCMGCVQVCKNHAIKEGPANLLVDPNLCVACGDCVFECPTRSMNFIQKEWTLEELTKQLLRDKEYYVTSGGGITVSGGECMMQHQFVRELFKNMKDNDVHTALDTSGFTSKEALLDVLKYTDCLLLDLKFIDNDLHKKYTGVENKIILDNAVEAASFAKENNLEIWIRTPLIPDATATENNVTKIGEFIKNNMGDVVTRWELCGFNNVCLSKYQRLGMDWTYKDSKMLTKEEGNKLLDYAKNTGAANGEIYVTGLLAE